MDSAVVKHRTQDVRYVREVHAHMSTHITHSVCKRVRYVLCHQGERLIDDCGIAESRDERFKGGYVVMVCERCVMIGLRMELSCI
jgi:hypothetical protein